jgi:acetyltransferase-like isoleucine patch superfamily enzyme
MPPRQAEVTIGDEVFIGSGAMILKGVNVGAGGVVGAGAVVSVDVPDGAVVAGNPAQVVRS